MRNPFFIIGSSANALMSSLNKASKLFARTMYWMIIGPFRRKFVSGEYIFEQMVFVGVRSLSIVFFVTFFTGVVLAMQSAYQLSKLGATMYVAGLVSVSMARELAPVLTALVVAGRVGAAITAQIGSMQVTEQIEALDTMALDPVRFLVVPRFLALLIMVPALTVFGDLMGNIGGYLIGVFNLKIGSALYIDIAFQFLVLKDIYTGIFKAFVFGGIIALVSCYQGLNTTGGAEGVGRSTTVSVVTSFILVILADCVLTGIFYFSNM
ncbi:MAG: ABC transporter permease [Candidatus Omnitrophica bacterium]|nr:ABC transporter permease [Candidatus Omnitrophota bacterium]